MTMPITGPGTGSLAILVIISPVSWQKRMTVRYPNIIRFLFSGERLARA
jgi:hypothetical protein